MTVFILLLLICAGGSGEVHGQAAVEDARKKVTVETIKTGGVWRVMAQNRNPFTITLYLQVKGENTRVTKSLPVEAIIPPDSDKALAVIQKINKDKKISFRTRYNWFMGNVRSEHDDHYRYALPYRSGESYRIGQTYDGNYSHTGLHRYSVDFMMPVGTQIYAARFGRVVQLKEDSDIGGPSERFREDANYVVIEHEDGTYAEYAHLQKNGVLVQVGQLVNRGQLIGLSGNTGYSSGPHLHFMVRKVDRNGKLHSLPVTFRTSEGLVSKPVDGKFYRAL